MATGVRRPESGSHSQRRAERREREGGGKGGERRQAKRGETEKRERERGAKGGGRRRRLLEQLDGKAHEDEGAAGLQGGSEDGSGKGPGRAGRARVAANPLHLVERVGRIAQHLGWDGCDSSNR